MRDGPAQFTRVGEAGSPRSAAILGRDVLTVLLAAALITLLLLTFDLDRPGSRRSAVSPASTPASLPPMTSSRIGWARRCQAVGTSSASSA
jgi:hypothetical protein